MNPETYLAKSGHAPMQPLLGVRHRERPENVRRPLWQRLWRKLCRQWSRLPEWACWLIACVLVILLHVAAVVLWMIVKGGAP